MTRGQSSQASKSSGGARAEKSSDASSKVSRAPNVRRSLLFDLAEFKVDRRRAAEDGHGDLDPRAGLVDFLDHSVEGGERPVRDTDVFADLDRIAAFGRSTPSATCP